MEFVICFALIVILIRLKVPVGVTLLITAGLLSFLEFGISREFIAPFQRTLVDLRTWHLIATIILVITLSEVLSRAGFLERMVNALNSYISPRAVAKIAPALIGLLPMPGGAMVSAPIIEELARGSSISAETKTTANYWWRHIWEPVWPLYQSVILAAAILGISVWQVAGICFPITIAFIVAGTFLIKLPLRGHDNKKAKFAKFSAEMTYSLWPVIFIVMTGFILHIDLVISLLILFVILLASKATAVRIIFGSLKKEFSFDVILLFFGGLSLMQVIETGRAAENTLASLHAWGVPADLIVFTLPFLVGLLTGLTAAYVGVGFPIVSSAFALTGGLGSGILLAYAGGLMGIMLSPVHLCLVLTKKYFAAGFKGIYQQLMPVVLLAALLVFLTRYLFYRG